MIPVPSGVRVWLAVGHTDMRRGMNGLALQVQQALGRDPHAGDLYVFRGARGDLIKVIWHDGIGMSLYSKRLESGRFIWPSPAEGAVAISAAQLAYKDGIPRAKPTILEPIGLLKVTIPDANLGDIMSDISSKRRGTVLGMNAEDGMQIVEAEVPMAEMSSYTIDLRSMTQGRGSFTCKFVRYEEAPGNVQQKVIEEAKALADAE